MESNLLRRFRNHRYCNDRVQELISFLPWALNGSFCIDQTATRAQKGQNNKKEKNLTIAHCASKAQEPFASQYHEFLHIFSGQLWKLCIFRIHSSHVPWFVLEEKFIFSHFQPKTFITQSGHLRLDFPPQK